MTWHYAIRDGRLAEVFEGLPRVTGGKPDYNSGPHDAEGYCLLGWRDAPTILRDIQWVIKGIRYDRRKRRMAS